MHLKIVLDVIKDTASTSKMQTGSSLWECLDKRKVFHWLPRLNLPSGHHMTCRHGGTGKMKRAHTYERVHACVCRLALTQMNTLFSCQYIL